MGRSGHRREEGDPGSGSIGAVEFGDYPATLCHHGQKDHLQKWNIRGSTPIDSCGHLWTNRPLSDPSPTPFRLIHIRPHGAHIVITSPPTAPTQGYPQVIHKGPDPCPRFRDLQAVSVDLENPPQISPRCNALALSRGCNRHADACDRRRAGVSSDHLRGGDARPRQHALGKSDSSDSTRAWQGLELYREVLNMPKDLSEVATSTSPWNHRG